MRYKIRHSTWYEYSRPVFIEPHQIRLCPRNDPAQKLLSFDIQIVPDPAGLGTGLDAENNPFHLVWFNDLTDRLQITAAFTVETTKTNPFDSFLTAGDALPISLSAGEQAVLGPYLDYFALLGSAEQGLLDELCDRVMKRSGGKVLAFLNQLNRDLFISIAKTLRLEAGIQTADETLKTGRGACRDTAVVFLTACRKMGIPCRYVSGCQEGDPDIPEAELHAWAEVYLPGFGWKGYDPTHGLAVADRHIAYAASALPENTAPLSGSFRGTGASSNLSHRIEMEPDD
jgi:transglutaminase-like putative cysteine protease